LRASLPFVPANCLG
jgi:hypothetical protein